MIMIFGKFVQNVSRIFFIFSKFWFFGLLRESQGKKWFKITKNSLKRSMQACQWMACDHTCLHPHMPVFLWVCYCCMCKTLHDELHANTSASMPSYPFANNLFATYEWKWALQVLVDRHFYIGQKFFCFKLSCFLS